MKYFVFVFALASLFFIPLKASTLLETKADYWEYDDIGGYWEAYCGQAGSPSLTDNDFHGGTLDYGCNTFATDEIYTHYKRNATDYYQAMVWTGGSGPNTGGMTYFGASKNNNNKSSIEVPYASGYQDHGVRFQ